MNPKKFHVVVPFFNEGKWIGDTMHALANQSDADFALTMVDNGSTDKSSSIVDNFMAEHPEMSIARIVEPQKGTGSASDTGFRHAIAQGAEYIARTDADCLPHVHWVRNIKKAFLDEDLEFIAGKVEPRTDEFSLTVRDKILLPLLVWAAENHGRLYRRGKQFKYRYFMMSGNNMAITTSMYQKSGGWLRIGIEDGKSDLALSETVRTLTTRASWKRDVIVYNSIRRLRAYGYIRTIRWYLNRSYVPEVVDVR